MSPSATGLARDVALIRRRAWLFLPFLLVGIVVALLLGTAQSGYTARASMQLETVVHGLPPGSDRGIRVFEAQSMTGDPSFIDKVEETAGVGELNSRRYSVSSAGGSSAENLSRVTLTVSVTDPERAEAERLRDAFVEVFGHEFQDQDGLFRARYLERLQRVARLVDSEFLAKHEEFRELAAKLDLSDYEGLLRAEPADLTRDLNAEAASLQRQLFEVEGALAAVDSAGSPAAVGAIASSTLGQPIAPADARAALEGVRAALREALRLLTERQLRLSDPELVSAIDEVRSLQTMRDDAFERLATGEVAAASADTTMTVSRSTSGGVGRSMIERVAVSLAITAVFGLVAIYLVEWLSQIRTNMDYRADPSP